MTDEQHTDETTTETTETTETTFEVAYERLRDPRVLVLALWAATLLGWTLMLALVTPDRLDDGEAPPPTLAPVETTEQPGIVCHWEGEPNESAWLCDQQTTTTEAKG